ncbi:MAG: DNA repair protein RadC [Proteobacteria bacterium]|nr:DNA repair protein RadC [Pseudomonadota bacterium]MBU1716113.1 DNA repair protein RadC [Pseudomonadota bacterium]
MDKKEWQEKGKGHRQRLRDKFMQRGLDAFTDDEVVELLLTFGTPRQDCKEPARLALKHFGSLAALLEAETAELQKIKGIGPSNCFAIHFIQTVARRYLKQRIQDKIYLRSSREVAEYLVHSMRGLQREVFNVIFLDAAHAIIESKIIAEGTLTTNTIYPRELIKHALDYHAAAVVIAHNHPSGSLQPSADDRHLTRNLYLACSFVNIRLLDHLIIGGSEQPFSFADHGIMAEIHQECAPLI